MQQFISHQDGHEVHFSTNYPHQDNSHIYMYIDIFIYNICENKRHMNPYTKM